MSLTANSQGTIQGKFTIPANVPAGNKKVEFLGASGSNATASFFGRGLIELRQQPPPRPIAQQVTQNPASGVSRVDPLAQTFSLTTRSQIGAVELYVTAKGTTPIIVQIREVDLGFPTKTILAETQLTPTEITLNAWNRFNFANLLTVQPDVEYAIVVLCNDAIGAVGIAEMGKVDIGSVPPKYVTSQPYNVGVLLSSSNASTWTAHQDRDLSFRLLTAKYTEAVREISLGTVAATDATDILVMAVTDQPSSEATAEIELTFPDSTVRSAGDGQVIKLDSAITGNIAVKARLRSTEKESAMLVPGTQIVPGEVLLSADYVTRAFEADATGADITVIFDAKLPGSSAVTVWVKGDDVGDTWTSVPFDSSKALGGGKFEMKYAISSVTEDVVRVKLVLTGTISARPEIENLRISVT